MYSKRRKFRPKSVRMRLAAGLRPGPLGELERSPRSASRNWGCLLLRGEKAREGRKGGEGGKRKDDLHPTLFLGPEL